MHLKKCFLANFKLRKKCISEVFSFKNQNYCYVILYFQDTTGFKTCVKTYVIHIHTSKSLCLMIKEDKSKRR